MEHKIKALIEFEVTDKNGEQVPFETYMTGYDSMKKEFPEITVNVASGLQFKSVGNPETNYNQKFMNAHPLELSFDKEESIKLREILKEAQRDYGFSIEEDHSNTFTSFYIVPHTTSFANTFYHIGIMIWKEILSKRKKG
jgi:hypothetical protein